jgi:hypothetical protein
MNNWKRFGNTRSWPNFKLLSRHWPLGTVENQGNQRQNSRSLGPDLNLGLPEHEESKILYVTYCKCCTSVSMNKNSKTSKFWISGPSKCGARVTAMFRLVRRLCCLTTHQQLQRLFIIRGDETIRYVWLNEKDKVKENSSQYIGISMG